MSRTVQELEAENAELRKLLAKLGAAEKHGHHVKNEIVVKPTSSANAQESQDLINIASHSTDTFSSILDVPPPCNLPLTPHSVHTFSYDPNHSSLLSRETQSSAVSISAGEKFYDSLQRTKKEKTGDKAKKTKGCISPAKMFKKKLKQKIEGKDGKEMSNFDACSLSSCSSSSSQYGNMENIRSTLQKLMLKSEQKSNGNIFEGGSCHRDDFIGEKLASHHSPQQNNYNPLFKPVFGLLPKTDRNEDSFCQSGEFHSCTDHSHLVMFGDNLLNSSEDLSSLSTISQDSSEHVYLLHDKSIGNEMESTKITPRIADLFQSTSNFAISDPASSIEKNSTSKSRRNEKQENVSETISTLRGLSGEEGYMVLSGRAPLGNKVLKQSPYLSHNKYDEHCFESMYDNVSRLMESVREAAVKDADFTKKHGQDSSAKMKESSSKPMKTQNERNRYCNGQQGGKSFSYDSEANTSCKLGSNTSGIGGLSLRKKFEHSQETQITQAAPPMDEKQTRKSDEMRKESSIMKPLILATSPTEPSSSSVKKTAEFQGGGDHFAKDLFDPFTTQGIRQTAHVHQKSSFAPTVLDQSMKSNFIANRKSNYHTPSHPLTQKKVANTNLSALKWKKKFSRNKCRISKRVVVRGGIQAGNNNRLRKSGCESLLDEFNPLKTR